MNYSLVSSSAIMTRGRLCLPGCECVRSSKEEITVGKGVVLLQGLC